MKKCNAKTMEAYLIPKHLCFSIGSSERLKVSEFRISGNIRTYSPIQFSLNNVYA